MTKPITFNEFHAIKPSPEARAKTMHDEIVGFINDRLKQYALSLASECTITINCDRDTAEEIVDEFRDAELRATLVLEGSFSSALQKIYFDLTEKV